MRPVPPIRNELCCGVVCKGSETTKLSAHFDDFWVPESCLCTVRCVHFTSILGSLWGHFGVLGLHFGGSWSSGAGLWAPLGAFGRRGQILRRFREKVGLLLGSLLAPQISKVPPKRKKTVPRRQARKNVVPEHLQNGEMLILYSNYHMF